MTDELKPCPCCGGIALPKWFSISRPNESEPYGLSSEVRYYYECRECGLRTKDFPTDSAALEAWNRRMEKQAIDAYERTCEASCHECGASLDTNWGYCSDCGEWREL